MTSLIDKIEKLIKREKTTPERKRKDEVSKSSSEILSELFSAFNADPPKIEDVSVKKSKKSKKKHKKEKKKRSRSCSSSSGSDSDYSHKKKKRKKSSKKHKEKDRVRTPSFSRSKTPDIKPDMGLLKSIKKEEVSVKEEKKISIKIEPKVEKTRREPKEEKTRRISIKYEDGIMSPPMKFDASKIPMPVPPPDMPVTPELQIESSDLRFKLDYKKSDSKSESGDNDKNKGPKIQIKNLKFSAVYEETVKKAEEEARKKAKLYEEGEYTDSSCSSEKVTESNSQFPKSSDPGGILKKQVEEEHRVHVEDKSRKSKHSHSEHSHKSSRRDRSRSRKRSKSKSRRSRSRSRSAARRYRRSSSRARRRSRARPRSRSRSRRAPHLSRTRRRTRSPTGVKLADSEKKRLLEVARRNAINMLKNGAVPAGAAALPPHTRNQVMAAIQSGGKSVDELTDFCKHLSKKEALGELSSVSSNDEGSENEDTIAFHHPFLVKEKAPIVMNIRGGAPLPVKSTSIVPVANKEELRIQFPVSSGSQHREKASEWVPVSPKKTEDMQVAKLNSTTKPPPLAAAPLAIQPAKPVSPEPVVPVAAGPLALPAPPLPAPPLPAPPEPPAYIKNFTSAPPLATVPALPAPGPQAYPPGIDAPKIDYASIVSQKIAMIRKEQEENDMGLTTCGFGWSKDTSLGQFTGSTGAQILTPRELASGTQAWAKKDQLQRAAPVEGGMGMHLLQKMGWTPGQGLGKEGTGTLQPLLLEVKLDTKGLQAKEEAVRGKGTRGGVPRPGRRGPAPLVAGGKHPVSLLGEFCSKQKLGPPEYNLCFECGPDHKKNFLFKVKVAGVEYQPAVASANKKQAKADAAQLALQKLGITII